MVLIRDLPAKESDYVKVEDCGLGHDHTDCRKAEESVVQHLKVEKHVLMRKIPIILLKSWKQVLHSPLLYKPKVTRVQIFILFKEKKTLIPTHIRPCSSAQIFLSREAFHSYSVFRHSKEVNAQQRLV